MKKILIILFILIFSALAYELSVSYALFESEKEIIVNSDIGKWEISVNGTNINDSSTFTVNSVQVSSDSNVRPNYFAPGTSGYFEILINPNDTEVSIYYEIICRTDMITNTQIHLDRIENVDKPDLTLIAPFTYAGVIPLSDIESNTPTTLKFYITWNNNENNNEVDSLYGSDSSDFDLPMTITFRQYTGETIAPSTPTSSPAVTPTATPEATPAGG